MNMFLYCVFLYVAYNLVMGKIGQIPWNKGKLIERTCATCGKVFFKHPCRIKVGKGIFCSHSCHNRARLGEKHGQWKGDKVGYDALHTWVRRRLGKPLKCEFCDKTEGKFEWANKHRIYNRRELSGWISLCVSCHRKYDVTEPFRLSKKILAKKTYARMQLNKRGQFVKLRI